MCLSLEPSKMSDTILYAGDTTIDGRYLHVLGYQNKAENLFDGPNAMILPFPTEIKMGPQNVVDTTAAQHILTDMALGFEMRSRGGTKSLGFGPDDDLIGSYVEVFDSGDYTIVLAADARDVPRVIHMVPPQKRPRVNKDVFASYPELYPEWPVALCCWQAKARVEAQPMLWWYMPKHHDLLFLPAVDGHNGKPPNLKDAAMRDHTLVVGTTATTPQLNSQGWAPRYRDTLSEELQKYVPKRVVGQKLKGWQPNADIYVRTRKAHEASFAFDHVSPPGA
jgi:hypothetical protein